MARRDNAPKRKKTNKALTANQQEWKRQVTNLKRRIRSRVKLETKRFYDAIIPKKPDRILKKDLENLKHFRGNVLDSYVELLSDRFREEDSYYEPYHDYDTYESEVSETPVDIVEVELTNLRSFIDSFTASRNTYLLEQTKMTLLQLLDSAIALRGRRYIAETASEYADLLSLAETAMMQSKQEEAYQYIQGFANVLFGRKGSHDERIYIENIFEESGMFG